ncbi:hypothetical protein BG004_001969 [Podila humilis]|nr:hypothetical protein BG004_001969 [Podila humilis]
MAKGAKPTNPFLSSDVKNSFYFVQTAPHRYSAADYFKTFNPKISQKQRLHAHWSHALEILENSQDKKYSDQGSRLKRIWDAPDNGLGTFWQDLEDAETTSDVESSARINIRKRSLRSAEHNILNAIDTLDQDDARTTRRQTKKQALEKDSHDSEQENSQQGAINPAGQNVEEFDELLSERSTESDCEHSSSLSKGIYYLTGDGSSDCSKALWTPWLVNGQDLAPTLWRYRESVIDAAQRVAPLASSVERLAVNHIYLFERNNTENTLFDSVGRKDWLEITAVEIEQSIEDATLLDLQKLALQLSNKNHRESEELVLNWNGDRHVKKVLAGLVADDFLWPTSVVSKKVQGNGMYLCRAKKHRQGVVVQDDLEKLASMMKDAIDDLSKQGVSVSTVEIICLHVAGRLYAMKLEAKGIYVLRSIGTIYAPRSHFDFGVLVSTINAMMHVQKRLEKTISDISARYAAGEQGEDLTRPGFHTPTRVWKAKS